ncbi:hypothetical protein Moror_9624 [Moniliophthora roreri MCA 2997]|uniref:MIT domain-containing protein n=2 Tax=Moniliophthora roreri TaxID=221103 RepID=V2WJT5_MONRO|nr:hypothetical protein Moror_9624 [Moniliophthora roreri MCA 2997]KAI3597625.1 hypothetical protein WG66_003127 [Moniliophthora roreri]
MSMLRKIGHVVLGGTVIVYLNREFSCNTSNTMAALYVLSGVGWLCFMAQPFMTQSRTLNSETDIEMGNGGVEASQPLLADEKLQPSLLDPKRNSDTTTIGMLSKALESAHHACELDQANETPELAIEGYEKSVSLLDEVMEKLRNTENMSEAQNGRLTRLQAIRDTYQDRKEVLKQTRGVTVPRSE